VPVILAIALDILYEMCRLVITYIILIPRFGVERLHSELDSTSSSLFFLSLRCVVQLRARCSTIRSERVPKFENRSRDIGHADLSLKFALLNSTALESLRTEI